MDLQNLQSRHKIGACVIGRRELVEFARDIKFSHTIFSLPFVVVGLIIANVEFPTVRNAFIILLCMVSARSFAMGMNRFLDAGLDGQNLRTAVRAIPQGRLSKNTSIYINLCFALTFIGGSFLLSPLAGVLSLPLLVILGLYSMMKRWTIFTHFYLGLCLGLATIAAELALAGRVGHLNILLGLSILFWVAGFDILYSTQDIDIDRKFKLYSFP
ncbi:MAG: UbiA family prenyltransferase, partial [Proteobacteria bacterium]|nr:UbiA family prenyltransferase [Pseudomonadota bacterium]